MKFNLSKIFSLEKFEKSAIIIFVLGIFVVFNFLLSFVSLRLDYSYGQNHTLSSATKKVLSTLDDVVNIKLYMSSDLPLSLTSLKTDVLDLVNEYQKSSKGKIVFKVVDPKKDDESAAEAQQSGIPELQYSQVEKDKYAVATAYFGAVVTYGDKKEVIPQLSSLETLEYDMTSLVYKLTRKEPIIVGIVNGSNQSPDPRSDEYGTLRKVLEQQYTLQYFDKLDATNKPDTKIKTLLVMDDNIKVYATDELNIIRDYLKENGSAVFMTDAVKVLPERMTTENSDSNLSQIFAEYGINIQNNLVLSTSAQLVNFGNGLVNFMSPYPFWLKTTNFDTKNQNLSGVGVLVFPWTSSLIASNSADLKISSLVKSESKSWVQTENYTLDPNTIKMPVTSELKTQDIVMESEKKSEGKIAIIPSSRFVKEQFLSRNSDNLGLVINLINNYASSGALSGIRTRSAANFPLRDTTDSEKDFYKYINILLLPALFGLFGVYRITKRG